MPLTLMLEFALDRGRRARHAAEKDGLEPVHSDMTELREKWIKGIRKRTAEGEEPTKWELTLLEDAEQYPALFGEPGKGPLS
jgi:hypothetical protein